MQNFAGIGSAILEKMTFEVDIFGNFADISKPKFHFRCSIWTARCDVVRLYCLAELPFFTFCKRKTRGETQFWIELAAPCTLANHNEINFDGILPFIIFLTTVSCDDSNRLWRQRLLLSPCSL